MSGEGDTAGASPVLTPADAADGPLYVLGLSAGAGAVRDRAGRVVGFSDPETCQAVAHYLAADGYGPLLAPLLLDDPTGVRVIESDQDALAVVLELLDGLADLRRRVRTIAKTC
jgi:hypothetical protein